MMSQLIQDNHRFLDEAGDTTFYGKGKVPIIGQGGATDDLPEVRKVFFEFLDKMNCSFEAYVGRKIPALYENKHNGKEAEFYADLLSHLLKNKHNKDGDLKLILASRGKTTKNQNLELALKKAIERNRRGGVTTKIKFDVQSQRTEPLLNVADYFCWSVQRVFERGDTRYYDFLKERISVVVDLYDSENYKNYGNFYSPKKPLTPANLLK